MLCNVNNSNFAAKFKDLKPLQKFWLDEESRNFFFWKSKKYDGCVVEDNIFEDTDDKEEDEIDDEEGDEH